jgi:hypothetical protein
MLSVLLVLEVDDLHRYAGPLRVSHRERLQMPFPFGDPLVEGEDGRFQSELVDHGISFCGDLISWLCEGDRGASEPVERFVSQR